jgi:hypothetical protein
MPHCASRHGLRCVHASRVVIETFWSTRSFRGTRHGSCASKKALVKVRVIRTGLRMTRSFGRQILHQLFLQAVVSRETQFAADLPRDEVDTTLFNQPLRPADTRRGGRV